ncbi:MAG: hypothetical protein QW806_08695 [Nitrososphaerota archaeon]
MEESYLPELNVLEKIIELKFREKISLYDKGWVALYFLMKKKEDLEFSKILKFDIEDVLINKDKISEILLDIERTVGLILGLYCLLKLKKLNRKFITQIKNFIKQLEDLYWLEYDGELIFSISLLSTILNLKLNFKEILKKSFEKNVNIDKLRNEIYALLTLSQREFRKTCNEEIKSLLQELTRKENIELSKSDIELSSILCTALTNILEYNQLNEELRGIRDELFKTSYSEIIKLSENSQLISKITEIVSLAKEIKRIKINEELKNIIKISDKELRIDLEKLPSLNLKLNLLSKFLISALEGGFKKPYFLSRKEYDTYLQIKNEIKGYKRVRKYELLTTVLFSEFFILISVLFLSKYIFHPFLQDILYALPVITLMIFYRIYKRGYISVKEIISEFLKLFKR